MSELIDCPRCGRKQVEAHYTDKHLCVECVKAEDCRVTYYRQHQEDWLALAADAGLDVWLQQPGETQWEYTIWSKYRDSYPGKKPTYGSVAQELQTSYNVVKKVSQRWTFPVRMQAWMVYCDQITMTQRRREILDMNKTHVRMAAKMNKKIEEGIDAMDSQLLKASDIASLMRVAADLERKARVDSMSQEQMLADMSKGVENPELKKKSTNVNDLSEVVAILAKAGALDGLNLKQTVTTEVTLGDGAIDVLATEVD